jgi:hypothetical protein
MIAAVARTPMMTAGARSLFLLEAVAARTPESDSFDAELAGAARTGAVAIEATAAAVRSLVNILILPL